MFDSNPVLFVSTALFSIKARHNIQKFFQCLSSLSHHLRRLRIDFLSRLRSIDVAAIYSLVHKKRKSIKEKVYVLVYTATCLATDSDVLLLIHTFDQSKSRLYRICRAYLSPFLTKDIRLKSHTNKHTIISPLLVPDN